ncbi:unnamed protein product [Tilletia controversa]|uniref:LAA1-like C-terminal TPR repeats domain-containing protein n=1 Tax=Tilletia controversa TaxID=13291 RepID=A0A8X7N028_9BASI|nr:hypothetical protein CF328_g355 [Tilletia controversa]KAE8255369.1 hypothetical protein A4X06_0g467 [Tilletia controversa]CAD6928691.1 unnamed protein product [Tilletia controversa]CAD6935231.1 unnamed protein product [Tilletia controversa]CAD6943175.1 unnamed protein product [Tilletia controversa]
MAAADELDSDDARPPVFSMLPADAAAPETYLKLDEAKLAAAIKNEQGEIHLLEWLSKAEAALQSATPQALRPIQKDLERTFLRLIHVERTESSPSAPAPAPAPAPDPATLTVKVGRPERHLLARCFVSLLSKGDSRNLFDVISSLVRIANDDSKTSAPDRESKVAALHVAGVIFGSMGQQVMSLFAELITLTLKIIKATGQPVILRHHALRCLQRLLRQGGRSLNDVLAKDAVTRLRAGLSDKASPVVRGSADCLVALLHYGPPVISSRSETEAMLTTAFKALDGADPKTVQALAKLGSKVLAGTQKAPVPSSRPPPKSSAKKKAKDAPADDSDEEDAKAAASSAASEAADFFLLTPKAMLDQLASMFNKPTSSRRVRAAIFNIHGLLFAELGIGWVETNYALIVQHLCVDLPNTARTCVNSAEELFVRQGVLLLLRKLIGEQMLSEPAQVAAVEELGTSYLKRWPVVLPGQLAPSKATMVLALREVAALLGQLGTVPPQLMDLLQEPLRRCVGHPSHSVQIAAAWCLRQLCLVHPASLDDSISALLVMLNTSLQSLANSNSGGGRDLPRRCVGQARALAALVSIIPYRPLYASSHHGNNLLETAIQLLKKSSGYDLPISSIQINVAWILIGGLMSLGPSFVRPQLPQLFNLWRNALPKPSHKDMASGPEGRTEAEWGFLLHVRECALGAVYAFLVHNGPALLTLESSRKLVAYLSNSLVFVNSFTQKHPGLSQEQVPGSPRASLTLLDREHMLRWRLTRCFSALARTSAIETLQHDLLVSAVQTFAEPDRYVGSSIQAAIAACSGSFSTLWTCTDGYAFGVTSLHPSSRARREDDQSAASFFSLLGLEDDVSDRLNRDAVESTLDELSSTPILLAPEHDAVGLYLGNQRGERNSEELQWQPAQPPSATGVVDASIELFAAFFPYQERETQISTMETLLQFCRSSKLDRNPGRRLAIQFNVSVAILGALCCAAQGTQIAGGRKPAGFSNDRLAVAMREIIKDCMLQSDPALRTVASEAYGRLASISGSAAISSQVQFLVEQIVSNRDPDARAGCALSFGAIYKHVGGLAAGPLTKTVVNVLMSLCSDPHPVVHFWALDALQIVIDAAGLSYSTFVASTVAMVIKLYMQETHEMEGGSVGSANLKSDLPAHQTLCRVVHSLIGVLGPDLRDSVRLRSLILILLNEFTHESDNGVLVEATKSVQHLGLFAPDVLDTSAWIGQLRLLLQSNVQPVKLAAINSFYQLVQKQALQMSKHGGNELVEIFFVQLDTNPSIQGVREVIASWLRQTAELNPTAWIDLCQRIMTGAGVGSRRAVAAAKPLASAANALQDEELARIDLGDQSGMGQGTRGSRWRTQLFALQCLHELFITVRQSGRHEHFSGSVGTTKTMSSRVADLIKVAFSASTAANTDIRLEGLVLLRDVIVNFSSARDPEFPEALLMEQHQAPLAAALTPAFNVDSTPEVLALACEVCAVFVGSGIVKEVEKMGRILKQLVQALQACLDSTASFGDVKSLSANARSMLRVAVLSAWAELQIASEQRPYLVDVIKQHRADLSESWTQVLQEYAVIRASSQNEEAMLDAGATDGDRALASEVYGSYLDRAWVKILRAVTQLRAAPVDSTDDDVPKDSAPPAIIARVIYGLAFEHLSQTTSTLGADAAEKASRADGMIACLQAIRCLCTALTFRAYRDDVIEVSELSNMLYRLIVGEPSPIQMEVLGLIDVVSELLPSGANGHTTTSKSEEIEPKLGELLRLVLNALKTAFAARSAVEERAAVVNMGCRVLMGLVAQASEEIKLRIYTVTLALFTDILEDDHATVDVLSPTLPSLKSLAEKICSLSDRTSVQRLLHTFLSSCLTNVDDMSGRSGTGPIIKIRANLLSIAVVLTSLSADAPVSEAVLEYSCYLVGQYSTSPSAAAAVRTTATGCLRLLIAGPSREVPAIRFCVGQLLPMLVGWVANNVKARAQEGGEDQGEGEGEDETAKVHAEIVKEVYAALVSAFDSAPAGYKARIAGIVLPTFASCYEAAEADESLRPPTTLLLGMASSQPAAFREATANLPPATRAALENVMRTALEARASSSGRHLNPGGAGPARRDVSISLRSFG